MSERDEGAAPHGSAQGRPRVPVPPPSDDADRAFEARVRQKMYARERLSAEEKAYLTRMPGDKDARIE